MATKMARQETSSVYLLQHVAREGKDDEDVKILGIYSTERKAKLAIRRFKKLLGFRRYPKGFYVDSYTLDEATWSEGFVSLKPPTRGRVKRSTRNG